MVYYWVIGGLLLVLDLFFTVLRSSLINARLPFLLNLREARGAAVDRAIGVIERPRLRVSLRLAMAVLHISLAGSVLGGLWQAGAGPLSIWGVLGFGALGGVLLIALEFLVERIVLRNPEDAAIRLSAFAWILDTLLTPLSMILSSLWGYPEALRGSGRGVTEEDLKTWVEVGQPQGSLEKGERQMIFSIIHFGETLAREIMVPRIDILALDVNTPLADAAASLSRSGHSRLPVYEETIENIIGMLYAKDLLRAKTVEGAPGTLRELLRPAYFVPEAKKADELLTEMQSRRVHLAIVVDEYGGVAGLVSLEDIVEEIVGEIRDEYDQGEELLFQQIGPDEYVFQGKIDLDDFNEVMGTHLLKDTADTLGGFIYSEIGRIPAGGEQVEVAEEGIVLTVGQVIGRRIRKVHARRIQPAQEKELEDSHDNG